MTRARRPHLTVADHVRGVDHVKIRREARDLELAQHLRNRGLQGNDKERIGLHERDQIAPIRSKAHGFDGLAGREALDGAYFVARRVEDVQIIRSVEPPA